MKHESPPLITAEYIALQKDLHSRFNYGYGADVKEAIAWISDSGSVLDYGCGQGKLRQALGDRVQEYDPAIEGKDGIPYPADYVVCTDVLEHIEPELLDNVLAHIRKLTLKEFFFIIATNPSSKIMADGRQAHLIVEDVEWWQEKLSKYFEIDRLEDRTLEGKGLLVTGKALAEGMVPIGHINSTAASTDEIRNEQARQNIARVSKRVTVAGSDPKLPIHDRTAILVCAGPSLKHTLPAVALSKANPDCDVVSVSVSHRYLLEHNIVPYAHIDCDPRDHKPLQIGEPHKDVKYWLASCIHPSYLDMLEGYDVALWHSYNGEGSLPIMKMEPLHRMLIGGGSVGLRALALLYYLGYRKFEIHGMDCSFETEEQDHVTEHLGKKSRMVRVKCGDRWFNTSATLILYERFFSKQMKHMADVDIKLHGDGMLQFMEGVTQ